MKRIAVISYHTCPLSDEEGKEAGGMNIYVLELSKELAKRGYILDVYTRSQDKDSKRIVEVSPGLRVIHIPAGEEKSYPKKELLHFIPEFIQNITSFIEEQHLSYKFISAHYYMSGIIGLELRDMFHIPMTITFHTLALMKNLVARSDAERDDVDRIKAELLLVKEADRVIATSENDAVYLETLYDCPKEMIVVLTPGVNLELFKPMNEIEAKKAIGADCEHKLILFVGRIEPLKGIDVLLYAIKILLEKNPGIKICVWIVGGDVSETSDKWSDELQKLDRIKNLLNIATAVKFVGKKQQKELPSYYNAAEIAVMPSQYESFGITALEAMACGTPVITTDVTGISGLLDKTHGALITSANNPIMLAEKIRNLVVNEKEHAKFSKEVFEKVQDMSWKNVAERFEEMLMSCA